MDLATDAVVQARVQLVGRGLEVRGLEVQAGLLVVSLLHIFQSYESNHASHH